MADSLSHYGIPGMKWGQRRARGTNGLVKKSSSSDHSESRVSKKKKLHEMSNSELQKLNTRLQLERTNKDLQSRGSLRKIKAGTAAVGTILAVGTTVTTAYNFANSPAGQAIKNTLFKK